MFYGNVEGMKEYLLARGKDLPPELTDEEINSALLVASEWLDGQYESSWIGYKTNGFKQERSWPRSNVIVQYYPYYLFGNDEIPEQVVKATYEAAYRHITKPNCLQTDYIPSQYKSVSVSGAVSVEYSNLVTSAGDSQLEIPAIQVLMEMLLDSDKTGNLSSLSGKAVRV